MREKQISFLISPFFPRSLCPLTLSVWLEHNPAFCSTRKYNWSHACLLPVFTVTAHIMYTLHRNTITRRCQGLFKFLLFLCGLKLHRKLDPFFLSKIFFSSHSDVAGVKLFIQCAFNLTTILCRYWRCFLDNTMPIGFKFYEYYFSHTKRSVTSALFRILTLCSQENMNVLYGMDNVNKLRQSLDTMATVSMRSSNMYGT